MFIRQKLVPTQSAGLSSTLCQRAPFCLQVESAGFSSWTLCRPIYVMFCLYSTLPQSSFVLVGPLIPAQFLISNLPVGLLFQSIKEIFETELLRLLFLVLDV